MVEKKTLLKTLFLRDRLVWMGFAVVLSFLFVVHLIGSYMFVRLDAQGRRTTVDALETILNSTQMAVHIWIKDRQYEVIRWAKSPILVKLVKEQIKLPRNQKELLDSSALAEMREFIGNKMSMHGFKGFFIITPDDINIGSMRDVNVGTKNLIAIQREEVLKKVFQGETLFVPPIWSDVPLGDAQAKTIGQSHPTMFIATPVKDENDMVIAVLTGRVPCLVDFSFLAQIGRIGNTGETYFFDKQALLLTESRFDADLMAVGLIKSDQSSTLNIEIRDPGGNLFEGFMPEIPRVSQPFTLMFKSAVNGISDKSTEAYNDYRGVPVLGAWLWDDVLDIGMATEIDLGETLKATAQVRTIFSWVIVLTVTFALAMALALIVLSRQGVRKVQESQQRFKSLVEDIDEWIWEVNQDGIYTYSSPRVFDLLGHRPDEIVGNTPFHFMPQAEAERIGAIFQEITSNKEPFNSLENINIHKNGNQIILETSGRPVFDDHGKLTGYRGVDRDITQRKSIEEALLRSRDLLNAAQEIGHVGSWEWNISSGELSWTDEIYRIFGREPQEFTAAYEFFLETVHPEDREAVQNAIGAALDGSYRYDIEHRIILPSGAERIVNERAIIERDEDGTPLIMIGTVQDITKIKKIENDLRTYQVHLEELVEERTIELQKSKEKAELGSRAKSVFLANMSHEIRTPMNSVIGYLDLSCEDPFLSEDTRKYLLTANRSAKNLLSIINDILDVSKLEGGKLVLESISFNVRQLTKEVLASMEIKARDLHLRMNVSPEVAQCYLGDPTRLRQVLLNLVGNAIKFTKQGGVTVEVKPARYRGELHFAVVDTGIGIPAEQLDTILAPFSQADSSTSRHYGGTGLGTTISHQLIELMDGRMWVESEVGQGTVFYFTIQLSESKDSVSSTPDAEKFNPISSQRIFHVLLAEDIKENADLVRTRLEQQGHHVTHVWDGQQAVDAYTQKEYDIILMDVQMPVIDGLEATRLIRLHEVDTDPNIPIIALTASVMQEEMNHCFTAGMDRVSGKPVDFADLFAMMEEVVPEGKGEIHNEGDIDSISPQAMSQVAYLNRLPGIDIERGVEQWQTVPGYIHALQQFALKQVNTAKSIAKLLEEGKFREGQQLSHSLKGLSGNLALDHIYGLASKVDTALLSENHEEAMSLTLELNQALQLTVNNITSLQLEGQMGIVINSEVDPLLIVPLFRELLAALDLDDPSFAEPIVEQLAEFLPRKDMDDIIAALKSFDFIAAKRKTYNLAEKMRVKIKGV